MVNNKGFTLVEIIIAILIAAILTAAGLYVYSGLTDSAKISVMVQNITKLKKLTKQYAEMNGYSFSNLSAASMKTDELLPSAWSTDGNWGYPPNRDMVAGYWIGVGPWGVPGAFAIGVGGINLTSAMALNICNDFENQLAGIGYEDASYNISPTSTCANIITNPNTTLLSDQEFFLGFE